MSLRLDQRGSINSLLIPLILTIVFFLGSAGFAAWSYTQMLDYKNNVDQKIDVAVKVANDQLSSEKDNEFLEREKKPLKTYAGPSLFGDISFSYPKTWSGYVVSDDRSFVMLMDKTVVDGADGAKHALRVEVIENEYVDEIENLESEIEAGNIKSSAFRLKKLQSVLGVRADGNFEEGVAGSKVYLPLRDKTILISVESPEYLKDFNDIILPSFDFKP